MKFFMTSFSVLCVACFLVACGFSLRGSNMGTLNTLPFSSVYVEGNGTAIAADITALFEQYPNLKIMPTAKGAEAMLRITNERKFKDVLTINRAGNVTEYLLMYSVVVQLYLNGEQVGPPIVLKQSRNMTYSDSDVLGKTQEENLLWTDMTQTVARTLLYRLSSNTVRQQAASAAAAVLPPLTTTPIP